VTELEAPEPIFDQLLDGSRWKVPPWVQSLEVHAGPCRSCGARIRWAVTTKGARAPLNPDGTSHFATCPDADRWRKKR
jgi:hypothetical protein